MDVQRTVPHGLSNTIVIWQWKRSTRFKLISSVDGNHFTSRQHFIVNWTELSKRRPTRILTFKFTILHYCSNYYSGIIKIKKSMVHEIILLINYLYYQILVSCYIYLVVIVIQINLSLHCKCITTPWAVVAVFGRHSLEIHYLWTTMFFSSHNFPFLENVRSRLMRQVYLSLWATHMPL